MASSSSSADQAVLIRALGKNLAARGIEASRYLVEGSRFDDALVEELKNRELGPDRTSVLVALSGFEPEDFLRGLWSFLAQVPPEDLLAWRASFTQARYLLGSPRRFLPFLGVPAILSPSGAIAWMGPAAVARQDRVVRLLRPLKTDQPMLPRDLELVLPGAGEPAAFELRIAMSQAPTLKDYLVALGHALAEPYVDGVIGAMRLRVTHVDHLDELPSPYIACRVHLDRHAPGQLALHTCLVRSTSSAH